MTSTVLSPRLLKSQRPPRLVGLLVAAGSVVLATALIYLGGHLVEEARRVGADGFPRPTIHAPAGEQRIGPTAAYLPSKPLPCDHRDRQPAGASARGRRDLSATAPRTAMSQLSPAGYPPLASAD